MKIDHALFRTGVPLIDRQHEEYLELVQFDDRKLADFLKKNPA